LNPSLDPPKKCSPIRSGSDLLEVRRSGAGIAIYPGVDHGLFTDEPDPDVARTDQLAAGFLPVIREFLAARHDGRK
jgi:uncharacterized protein